MLRNPTCIISSSGASSFSHGHAADRFAEIGSLTKVLTGTALMRMDAAGELNADDPVHRWLPVPTDTGITLRQLAEHTSGLPRLPPGLGGRDPYAPFDQDALGAALGRLGSIAVRPPGQAEEYSNFGYAVLGAALVSAAAMPYEELLHRHVLAPLGVTEVVANPPSERRLNATSMFGRERQPWTMNGPILPAGGLWATPRAATELLTGLLVDQRLGPPAPSWRRTGPLVWHNGATRDSSAFAGALPDGRWVLVHRIGARPQRTDRMGIRLLAQNSR